MIKRILPLLLATAAVIYMAVGLTANHREYFAETQSLCDEGLAVCLKSDLDPDALSGVLLRQRYVADSAEAQLIADSIAGILAAGTGLGSLNDLKTRSWQLQGVTDSAPGALGQRAAEMSRRLGHHMLGGVDTLPYRPGQGQGSIAVTVTTDELPLPGTAVMLTVHSARGAERDDSVAGFLRTGADGTAVFTGLDPGGYYSVLPVDTRLEFGGTKGTPDTTLAGTADGAALKLAFDGRPLATRMFDNATIRLMRDEHRLTVRTPSDFTSSLYIRLAVVVALFWLLALRVGRRGGSLMLPAVLLALAGIGIVNMYSLSDPLTGTLMGERNATGVTAGAVLALLLTFVDPVRFYQDRSALRIGRLRVRVPFDIIGRLLRLPKGTGYLLAAIALTLMLFPFGGSEVGGMRVNLNLGIPVQPSEVSKYLMVMFMAAYFSENAGTIIRYSRPSVDAARQLRRRLRMMFWYLLGIVLLMGLYLVLSDMGPALVILVTFVLYYSMVKSTVAVKPGDTPGQRLKGILTCDLATLVCGVVTFMGCVAAGAALGSRAAGALAWLVLWLLFCLVRKKIHESAILFNTILAMFLFGGTLLGTLGFESEAQRFEQRMSMSRDPWGELGITDGAEQSPAVNSQVAEGLWALSSGGFRGQGLGQGMPSSVPAYNTDMVMASWGENAGFAGIALVLALYCILLWLTLRIGYRSGHTFAFYLCMGIAIVTAVQLAVITMGCLGMIPLTGITVPLMSYGMSSLVMNLIAYGLVLAVAAHTPRQPEADAARQVMRGAVLRYNYPVALASLCGLVVFGVIAANMFDKMVLSRSRISARPVFALASDGRAVISYNPRLLYLAGQLGMADIYDRNGVLLATSHPERLAGHSATYASLGLEPDTLSGRRIYPFGEHLYFMLGDYNTREAFSADDSDPVGYLAEARHLEQLRGYDNRYRLTPDGRRAAPGAEGTPVLVDIISPAVRYNRYTPLMADTARGVAVRDYSALVPYLESGLRSGRIKRQNIGAETILDAGRITPEDVRLTVDARLQTRLQQALAEECGRRYADRGYVRVSAVILDARTGDMLTSACYPLHDSRRMADETANGYVYYTDNNRDSGWQAFTDRDLGLTYLTAPGSTAKVMTAMAGYAAGPRYADSLRANHSIYVYRDEIIERSPDEPKDDVTLDEALAISSNCYFIKLANRWDLYDEMADIYERTGAAISVPASDPLGGYGRPAYTLTYKRRQGEDLRRWQELVGTRGAEAVARFRAREASRSRTRMNVNAPAAWFWAWGQGSDSGNLGASPLVMARVVSAVAGEGLMPHTRFTLDEPVAKDTLMTAANAANLRWHLRSQIKTRDRQRRYNFSADTTDNRFGGKTGTPRRTRLTGGRRVDINDAWYIFYIDDARVPEGDATRTSTLAVAVRIERSGHASDGAMDIAGNVVVKTLRELNYIE